MAEAAAAAREAASAALHQAAEHGNLDGVLAALAAGADPNYVPPGTVLVCPKDEDEKREEEVEEEVEEEEERGREKGRKKINK